MVAFPYIARKHYFCEKIYVMEDKVIEIARFENTTEAEMLAGLLKSEGIECYVRDGIISSNFFGSVDIGGAKVDLLKKDVRRALEIMKDHNYNIPEDFMPDDSDQYDTDDNRTFTDDEIENNNGIASDDEREYCNNVRDSVTSDDIIEEDNTIYANNKAKLSKNMTIILVLMVILFGILVFLNKYYNG